jgi:DNA-binding Lrp family transcriptional regulator
VYVEVKFYELALGIIRSVKTLKDTELNLIAELMRNSRRSDRDLAKAIGVSQPTVSRMIKKLEKEGVIREYTMIPDFRKLGFELMSLVTTKENELLREDETVEAWKKARELAKKAPQPFLFVLSTKPSDADTTALALHKNYSEYVTYLKGIKENPLVSINSVEGFIAKTNLNDHFIPLTLSEVADFLEKRANEQNQDPPCNQGRQKG